MSNFEPGRRRARLVARLAAGEVHRLAEEQEVDAPEVEDALRFDARVPYLIAMREVELLVEGAGRALSDPTSSGLAKSGIRPP